MEFVGCYNGNIEIKEEKAAVGLCWREDVISVYLIEMKQERQLLYLRFLHFQVVLPISLRVNRGIHST